MQNGLDHVTLRTITSRFSSTALNKRLRDEASSSEASDGYAFVILLSTLLRNSSEKIAVCNRFVVSCLGELIEVDGSTYPSGILALSPWCSRHRRNLESEIIVSFHYDHDSRLFISLKCANVVQLPQRPHALLTLPDVVIDTSRCVCVCAFVLSIPRPRKLSRSFSRLGIVNQTWCPPCNWRRFRERWKNWSWKRITFY
ncbi:hypothetical protein TNCT_605601 [Trichonephila clavata]|uniref:Uncharacterized protein n=1 Tax=Trichonephila clavata TaxID=2740835 RepID=A0A8X6GU23_TRICU|nr:hypothetical protein TNCT_605601 [Trichonephila clavata]